MLLGYMETMDAMASNTALHAELLKEYDDAVADLTHEELLRFAQRVEMGEVRQEEVAAAAAAAATAAATAAAVTAAKAAAKAAAKERRQGAIHSEETEILPGAAVLARDAADEGGTSEAAADIADGGEDVEEQEAERINEIPPDVLESHSADEEVTVLVLPGRTPMPMDAARTSEFVAIGRRKVSPPRFNGGLRRRVFQVLGADVSSFDALCPS